MRKGVSRLPPGKRRKVLERQKNRWRKGRWFCLREGGLYRGERGLIISLKKGKEKEKKDS